MLRMNNFLGASGAWWNPRSTFCIQLQHGSCQSAIQGSRPKGTGPRSRAHGPRAQSPKAQGPRPCLGPRAQSPGLWAQGPGVWAQDPEEGGIRVPRPAATRRGFRNPARFSSLNMQQTRFIISMNGPLVFKEISPILSSEKSATF